VSYYRLRDSWSIVDETGEEIASADDRRGARLALRVLLEEEPELRCLTAYRIPPGGVDGRADLRARLVRGQVILETVRR
jgi:hypothetical protein